MRFDLPLGNTIYISMSRKLEDEYAYELDEKIPDCHWNLQFNDLEAPIYFETKRDAILFAQAAQWGANQMFMDIAKRRLQNDN